MITVFHYPACGSCKKAKKWLEDHQVEVEWVNIVESPPPVDLLKKILSLSQLPITKLFNTSGQVYRQGDYKNKIKTMSEGEALQSLAAHGKLIKRPLLVAPKLALVGFKPESYEAALLP
jgi:arsenate reductase